LKKHGLATQGGGEKGGRGKQNERGAATTKPSSPYVTGKNEVAKETDGGYTLQLQQAWGIKNSGGKRGGRKTGGIKPGEPKDQLFMSTLAMVGSWKVRKKNSYSPDNKGCDAKIGIKIGPTVGETNRTRKAVLSGPSNRRAGLENERLPCLINNEGCGQN